MSAASDAQCSRFITDVPATYSMDATYYTWSLLSFVHLGALIC